MNTKYIQYYGKRHLFLEHSNFSKTIVFLEQNFQMIMVM